MTAEVAVLDLETLAAEQAGDVDALATALETTSSTTVRWTDEFAASGKAGKIG